jgi:hypothetical protein
MNNARSFVRRTLRKPQRSAAKREFLRRGLAAEQLESRAMLAGDWFYSDFWNGAMPEDVNNDRYVSPIDALLIINELNTGGSRALMGGLVPPGTVPDDGEHEGEGEGGNDPGQAYYDVNNDGYVSPIDSLLVINALNAEGEDPIKLMKYKIYVVDVGTPVTELPDPIGDPPDTLTTIPKGQDYELVVTVQDLRSGSQFGVAAGFLDLLYDKSLVSVPVYELQDIVITGSPTGGNFRLSFGGNNTGNITFNQFNSTTTSNNIDAALEALPSINLGQSGTNNVEVTLEPEGYRVRFINALGDQDVGDLTVLSTNFTGGSSPSAHIDYFADGVRTDPNAFEDAFRSRKGYPVNNDGGENPAFYRGQPLFWAVDMPTGVDDLGGAYLTVDPPHPGTFERELARVRMIADNAGTVVFTPSLANITLPAHQSLLYASQPQDRSVIDPINIDLGSPVSLTITELVTANPDVVNIVEGAGATNFNPIFGSPGGSPANGQDVKSAGAHPTEPLRITAVNGQTSGTINLPSGATVTFNGSTGSPSITYTPAAEFSGQDVFSYTVSDTVNTDTTTVTVNVAPVNDAPRNLINGSEITGSTPARSATEDTPFIFNGSNVVSVSDVDTAASTNNEFRLDVTNGTVTLSTTTGLTLLQGANSTALMRYSGSLASINAALNGMTFNPTPDFAGGASVTIRYDDQGNTGGGNLFDQDVISINVAAVNDNPDNLVPGDQTVDESPDTLEFSTLNSNRITVSDVDHGGTANFQVTLDVDHGTLNVPDAANVTIQFDNTATVIITGTLANINAALDGLIYSPTSLFVGDDVLTVTSNDNGATGSGGAKQDTDTVNIEVLATVRPRARPNTYNRVESDGAFLMPVMSNDDPHLGGPPYKTTLLSVTPIPANRGLV